MFDKQVTSQAINVAKKFSTKFSSFLQLDGFGVHNSATLFCCIAPDRGKTKKEGRFRV
jgi:hypothetical protein